MRLANLFSLLSVVTFFVAAGNTFAQTGIYNQGVPIFIPPGAVLTINGNYIDNGIADGFLDEPIFLSGTLRINGSIINNSENNYKLIQEASTGQVVLTAGGAQLIGGPDPIHIPNLSFSGPGLTTAVIEVGVEIPGVLNMANGSMYLNGPVVLTLSEQKPPDPAPAIAAQIINETTLNAISGSFGSEIRITPMLSLGNTDLNVSGIGFGYIANAGDVFSAVWLTRRHGINHSSLADGVSVLRTYQFETSTTDVFQSISFRYHNSELNTLGAGNLALYSSNDNGQTWIKASSSVANNIVTALNVPIVAGQINLLTLAVANCNDANSPSVAITANSAIAQPTLDICENEDLNLSIEPTLRMRWNYPVSQSSTQNNITVNDLILFTNTGNYSVWAANSRGCERSNAVAVTVRDIPTAHFTITPDPASFAICFGTELQFTGTYSTADGTTVNDDGWAYTFGDAINGTSNSQTPSHTYSSVGFKNPSLIVNTQYCTSPAFVYNDLPIQSLPVPVFNFELPDILTPQECEDIAVSLSNASTYDPIADYSSINFSWNFGDATAIVDQNLIESTKEAQDLPDGESHLYLTSLDHAFLQEGSFIVTLTAEVESTGCTAQVNQQITIHPEPDPLFTIQEQTLSVTESCPGVYLEFLNATTIPDGTGITYSWNFSDGPLSTEISPVRQFVQHNTYPVTLTATSTAWGCTESTTIDLIVHPAPTGTFTVADPDVCPEEEAVFFNTSSVAYGTLSYEWEFGDDAVSNAGTPEVAHAYTLARPYNVHLIRTTDHGCTNTIVRTVRVRPNPVANFLFQNVCDGQEVSFYDASAIQSGNIVQHLWDFGDLGNTSLQEDPAYTFSSHNEFDVNLTLTSDFGCVGSVEKQVTVFQNPGFNLGASVVVCDDAYLIDPRSAVVLNAGHYVPDASTFQWTNAAGQFLGTDAQLLAAVSGVYTVQIVTPPPLGECATTVHVPLFLYDPVNLGNDRASCDQNVYLDAEEGITIDASLATTTSYVWSFNGNPTSTSAVIEVDVSGEYGVTVTRNIAGGSCQSADVINVAIEEPIVLTLPEEITGCENDGVLLDAGVSVSNYQWSFVDGGTPNPIGNGSSIQVSEPGFYYLEASNLDCHASTLVHVLFNQSPDVSFTVSDLSICAGETLSVNDLTKTSGLIMSAWAFGDGTTSSGYQPAIEKTFETAGTYLVSLSGTNAQNCTAEFTAEINVNALPTVDIEVGNACAGSVLNIVNNSTGATSFTWNFGDGTSSMQTQPLKSFGDAGSYPIQVDVTSDACSLTVVREVLVSPVPDLNFGTQVTTCGSSLLLDAANEGSAFRWFDVNTDATLSNDQHWLVNLNGEVGLEVVNNFGCSSEGIANILLGVPLQVELGIDRQVCDEEVLFPGYFPGATFIWSGGETSPTLSVNESGQYSVAVIDQNACQDNAIVNIVLNETPVIDLETSYVRCEGDILVLSAGTNQSYVYDWSTGETSAEIDVNATSSVSVVVTNSNCSAEAQLNVLFNPAPFVDFAIDNSCQDNIVSINNLSSIAGNERLIYIWDLGEVDYSAQPSPEKIFTSHGDYTVSLMATSENGCSNSAGKPVTIFEKPEAGFSSGEQCSGKAFEIFNISSYTGADPLAFSWNFGNGQASSLQQPEIVFTQSGSYVVSLTAESSHGCSDTEVKAISVGQTPTLANWSPSISSCNESVTLNAGNAGATYLWSTNAISQTISVSGSGVYSVLITAQDGCQAEAFTDVTFDHTFQSQLPEVIEGCGQVTLDPMVSASTFLWSTGAQTPTLNVSEDGVYQLQIVSANLCIGTDSSVVDVHPVPQVSLGADREPCVGDELSLEPVVDIPVRYVWSNGGTESSISVSESGNYTVTVSSDKNCAAEDNVRVNFNALPVIDLPTALTVCGTTELDARNVPSRYAWSTGATSQKLFIDQSGNYSVTVTNNKNCIAQQTTVVTVLPVPVVELGADLTLCHGETRVLDASNGGAVYQWSTQSTQRMLTVGSTGKYKVKVTNSVGCASADSVNVVARPPLGLNLGPDKLQCSNEGISITANVDQVSYQWGSSDGFSSTSRNVKPRAAGKYWVEIRDQFNCAARDTITITQTTQTITANFLIPSIVNRGDFVQFVMLTEPAPTFTRWIFGDGGSSLQANPAYRYFKTGEFQPRLIVSNGVCSDTLTKTISVTNTKVESEPQLSLPELIDILTATSYPNPCRGIVNVNIALTAEAKMWLGLFTMNGVLLSQQDESIKEKEYVFDITDQADGVYLIRVVVGNRSRVIKVIKTGGR